MKASVELFKNQFNQYPGDFNNAFTLLGSSCAATQAACNGDGNGRIVSVFQEEYMSFKHLSLAGLIPGSYTGTIGTGPVGGQNVPNGPFTNSGYSIAYTNYGTYWTWREATFGHN